ncbi:sigma-54-dependent Fis family transcriptional regulator, partial [bacterium]|nr:sigma-54-dependent Fis family transcriptional regulator [bacterium]
TGKELVARAIQGASDRRGKPFIIVNCGALPANLAESILFGHEKGAFTGADRQRQGRFEMAEGGTLFLDEVGDLDIETQVRLLRVLQEREFERVGGTDTVRTDVRVIAATNRNLEDLIAKGTFREDLYYRLNVFPIQLPPLRDRRSDILLLADHFAELYGTRNHKPISRIATPAIDCMMAYHWPGNVRELENCIERAALLAEKDVIQAHHLPPTLQLPETPRPRKGGLLQSTLDNIERDLIADALKAARGNKAAAARALGLSERLMGLRVHKHGIDPRRFRVKAK